MGAILPKQGKNLPKQINPGDWVVTAGDYHWLVIWTNAKNTQFLITDAHTTLKTDRDGIDWSDYEIVPSNVMFAMPELADEKWGT